MEKPLLSLLLLLCFIIQVTSLTLSLPTYSQSCQEPNLAQSFNYRGTGVTTDPEDYPWNITLCPGDAFGDLNGTYAVVQNCRLVIYRKDQIIWSIGGDYPPALNISETKPCDDCLCVCVFNFQPSGNLVLLKQELSKFVWMEKVVYWLVQKAWDGWESQTDLSPAKAELKLQDQQIQIVQTFEDGSQRLFYADENDPKFKEDSEPEEPVKVADKFLIKNHTQDQVFLQRNEYIGDLNGTHFIFHHGGSLLLRNQNDTIWSFTPSFRHACFLRIRWNLISICRRLNSEWEDRKCEPIMKDDSIGDVLQSNITFDDDQLILVQTLANGSEIIFSSGKGQNHGLKPLKKPNQIAKKTLNFSRDFKMERMDYFGHLDGLHLIFEQNCSLILRNANQKLWEFHPKNPADSMEDCSLERYRLNALYFKQRWRRWKKYSDEYEDDTEYLLLAPNCELMSIHLDLENNQLIIIANPAHGASVIYRAGPNTPEGTFQRIDMTSGIINRNDKND